MGKPNNKIKQLWKGTFAYRQEPHVLYRFAYTKRQAWAVMCRDLAKKQDVAPSVVMNYFNGETPNFEIKIEMEVTVDG
ncbi:MAG: hypothetical protein NUV80_03150 [Candidatus Berkelbacteria bacterium]|nr:hypothetical protein [Candidatus Berkelbacteria bacterium]